MTVLFLILLLLALVCFVASAFQVHSPKLHLISLGLAFWVAVPFIQIVSKL